MAAEISGHFPPTRRSAVMAAGSEDPAERAVGFERIIRAYQRPVYKHVRLRWRKAPDDAEELVQAFFSRALELRTFASFDPAKGCFRTYLKVCLDRFVVSHDRAEHRIKRGGNAKLLRLDIEALETEIARTEQALARAPDEVFDREWARVLFGSAVDALRETYHARGRTAQFEVFRRYVLDADGADRPTYAEIAAELGVSATDVTNWLFAARRDFRRLVLDKLRELTASEEEFRSEARAVLGVDP
jgi:RNA polymerase sigma factor (sigma-70 family)